jgi:hypothetical protein
MSSMSGCTALKWVMQMRDRNRSGDCYLEGGKADDDNAVDVGAHIYGLGSGLLYRRPGGHVRAARREKIETAKHHSRDSKRDEQRNQGSPCIIFTASRVDYAWPWCFGMHRFPHPA